MFHHHDLTSLGSVRANDGHLGVLPDITGGLPPLSEEQDPVPLEWGVRGGGEVQVIVTELNIEHTIHIPHHLQTNCAGYLLQGICRKILL